MAIFLESNTNTNMTTNQLTESIDYECYKFNEAIAYSEATWSNIIISSMQEEYRSLSEGKVLNEGIGQSIKNFFIKVIEWVKKILGKLKNFLSGVVNKLVFSFGGVRDFALKNGKAIMDGASKLKKKDSKITLNAWTDNNLNVNWEDAKFSKVEAKVLRGAIKTGMKAGGVDRNTDKKVLTTGYDNFFSGLLSGVVEIGKTKEFTITQNMAKNTITNALACNQFIKEIKSAAKAAQKAANKTHQSANSGLRSKTEAEANKRKDETTREKLTTSLFNRSISMMVQLFTKLAVDSHKVNKRCYSKSSPESRNSAKAKYAM